MKKKRPADQAEGLVCVGAFAGAHGVRGLVKLKSFTEEPGAIASYGPLWDAAKVRTYQIQAKGTAKGVLLVEVDGVSDREAAQALRGVRLHVPRDALPPPEDEDSFYHADLIGLAVLLREADGGEREIGIVRAVHDFGAGDVLEIAPSSSSGLRAADLVVPFTRAAVPVVDLEAGRVVIAPPDGQLEPADEAGKGGSDDD